MDQRGQTLPRSTSVGASASAARFPRAHEGGTVGRFEPRAAPSSIWDGEIPAPVAPAD